MTLEQIRAMALACDFKNELCFVFGPGTQIDMSNWK